MSWGKANSVKTRVFFFFLQVNAFFRYGFWSSLKTELLLCINTQIVTLCSSQAMRARVRGRAGLGADTLLCLDGVIPIK